MTEQYIGWALVVGMALGAAIAWFVIGRVPRGSDDISADERAAEAEWISRTVGSRGGHVPRALVVQVLDLHARYLEDRPTDEVPLATDAPPAAPDAPPAAPAGDAAAARGRSKLADEDRRLA